MAFSDNLQQLRKKSNLSQEKLAEQLNITRQAISKWEAGQSVPDVDTLMKLCEIFEVSPNQLLLGEDKIYSSAAFRQKKTNKSSAVAVFIIFLIFLIVILLCGTILLICNLYNGNYFEPKIHTLSLDMIYGSIGIFFTAVILYALFYFRNKLQNAVFYFRNKFKK